MSLEGPGSCAPRDLPGSINLGAQVKQSQINVFPVGLLRASKTAVDLKDGVITDSTFRIYLVKDGPVPLPLPPLRTLRQLLTFEDTRVRVTNSPGFPSTAGFPGT